MKERDGKGHITRAVFSFPPFRLDAAEQQFRRDHELIPLKPKAFAILLHLLERAGELVDKDELLRRFWGDAHIGEGVLKTHIREIREALGDGAQQARFIETVRSRGYRFIGTLEHSTPLTASSPDSGEGGLSCPPSHCPHLIGRQAELETLTRCWDKARVGSRQIVLVVGEAGIGKSALVTAWLEQRHADMESVLVAWGQCVEQYGSGEPYLPILEALRRAARGPYGGRLTDALRRHAPAWCAHIPTAAPLPPDTSGPAMTAERMMGQMADTLEALAQERGLVLMIEDLHWADHSTIDLLAYLARRSDPAQLLLVTTYRAADATDRVDHLEAALGLRDPCVVLSVPRLDEAAIGEYLSWRLGSQRLPEGVSHLLWERTEGNPLFVVGVVDGWLDRGLLAGSSNGCELRASLSELGRYIPASFVSMIEHQLDRLGSFERAVLEAASVVGREFATAAVAAALDEDVLRVEDLGMRWSRREHFVRAEGGVEWRDGTVSQRFAFVHVLYRQVIYEQIGAGRRALWHRRVGERLEVGHADEAKHIAPELALHFEKAPDYERALRYLRASGEQAASRGAYRSALGHVTRALELTTRLRTEQVRDQIELELLILSASLLRITKGFAAPEVKHAYARATEACNKLQAKGALLHILAGTGAIHTLGGSPRLALTFGHQFLLTARELGDHGAINEAQLVLGVSYHALGRHEEALRHLDAVTAPDESNEQTAPMSLGGRHPAVVARCFAAFSRCIMGELDRASFEVRQALEMAKASADPVAVAHALNFCGHVHLLRREMDTAKRYVEELADTAEQYGFAMFTALAVTQSGRLAIERGDASAGVEQFQRGWAELNAMGVRLYGQKFVSLFAFAHGLLGQRQRALMILDEALTRRDPEDERVWEAELLRTRGELLAHSDDPLRPADPGTLAEAEQSLLLALNTARDQRARLFELRAALSLARHWRTHRAEQAHALLGSVYSSFGEGLDTAELSAARRLLSELERCLPQRPRRAPA